MSRSFQHAYCVAMKSGFVSAFVLANTIGNKNKTQANRTQTAAAAAGYMAECLFFQYALELKGKTKTKIH